MTMVAIDGQPAGSRRENRDTLSRLKLSGPTAAFRVQHHMLTTIFYVLGALALHFSDVTSGNAFFSLLLPLFNIFFFIFLVWQLIFYFSLSSFANDDDTHFFTLVYELWHLDHGIRERGLVPALFNVTLLIVNAVSLVSIVLYYLDVFLDFL